MQQGSTSAASCGKARIAGGDDSHHTGVLTRRRSIHRDPRVRHDRPHVRHVRRAGEARVAQVTGVDAAGGQELGIFDPEDAGAEDAHRLSFTRARSALHATPDTGRRLRR